ncbi:MAG: hypothetical protein HC913_16695 [Microscillaceae bacterium]|nr:hypothetical protein [Microscillaceae bacterium]
MEKNLTQNSFNVEKVEAHVSRFQEMLYEFIKGLSALRREQNYFNEELYGTDGSDSF